MDDSKNTFGAKSRFAQLSKPRKAGLIGVILLIGFAVADPNFLSNDSNLSNSISKSDEDIDSLFGEPGDMDFVTEENAPVVTESTYADSASTLTIPSEVNRSQSLSVQNVSYPEDASSSDSAFSSIPADEQDPYSTAIGSFSDRTTSALSNIRHTQHTQHTQPATAEPQPSIRFMGMIYPVQ